MKLLFRGLLILISLESFAQTNVSIRPAGEWVKYYPYNDHVKDTSNTSGGFFYLLSDDQYNAQSKESYYHYAQKVLSEKGLESVSTVSQDFDPLYQTLVFHSISTIRNGVKTDQLQLSSFQVLKRETNLERLVYDGNLTAIFNLHDVQVGDIVEYSYTIKGGNPVFGNRFSRLNYFNFSVPMGEVISRVVIKSDRPFEIKKFNSPPEPVITKKGDLSIYEWIVKDVPALLSEESAPGWYDPYDHIQICDFGSWADVGHWADGLFKMNIPPGLSSKVPDINNLSKDEAIRKVIQFVQDEVRYLSFSEGIHGYKPHDPAKILSQRFGDCKDKSVLLASLLRELGVESYPVLVNTGYGKSLPDYLPAPSLFNHCIVQFYLRDSVHWIDPTISLQRGSLRQIHFPSYYNGLVIRGNTTALTKLPESQEGTTTTAENFVLDKIGGSADLTVTTTYTLQDADNIRSFLKSNRLNEIEKQYLNFYATDYPEIENGNPFKWKDNEENNVIVTEEHYKISNIWMYDSLTKQYSISLYPRALSTYLVKPKTRIRHSPYYLNFPLNVAHQITMRMPEEWNVQPTSKNIESSGFSYFSKISYADQIIDLSFRYQSKKATLEKSEIKEYITKLDEVLNNLEFNVTYTSPDDIKGKFNYPFFLILVFAIAGLCFSLRRVYDWDPEPKPSPERHSSIGGWLILPALGFCFTPVRMIYEIIVSDGYFDYSYWTMMTDSTSPIYRPSVGFFVLLEMLLNILFILYTTFLVYMFFNRRTSVPILAIIFYAVNVIMQCGDAIVASSLGLAEPDKETARSMAQAIVGSAIWIPYFLNSKRSRGTFVVRGKPPSDQQEVYQVRFN